MFIRPNHLTDTVIVVDPIPSRIMVGWGPTSKGEYGSGLIFVFLTQTGAFCKIKSEEKFIKELLFNTK